MGVQLGCPTKEQQWMGKRGRVCDENSGGREVKPWVNTEENSDKRLIKKGRSPLKEMVSSY